MLVEIAQSYALRRHSATPGPRIKKTWVSVAHLERLHFGKSGNLMDSRHAEALSLVGILSSFFVFNDQRALSEQCWK